MESNAAPKGYICKDAMHVMKCGFISNDVKWKNVYYVFTKKERI